MFNHRGHREEKELTENTEPHFTTHLYCLFKTQPTTQNIITQRHGDTEKNIYFLKKSNKLGMVGLCVLCGLWVQ